MSNLIPGSVAPELGNGVDSSPATRSNKAEYSQGGIAQLSDQDPPPSLSNACSVGLLTRGERH